MKVFLWLLKGIVIAALGGLYTGFAIVCGLLVFEPTQHQMVALNIVSSLLNTWIVLYGLWPAMRRHWNSEP